MFNETNKFIVYLDTDTLEYMYLNYTKRRNYPVMNKLYSLLSDGFVKNVVVTPLAVDHLSLYIHENQIDMHFLNMMGELGQVQFLQRFTVKMLQLIRVINHFFEQTYKKPLWKDVFSSDPDEKYTTGFNKYHSITAQNVIKTLEREKKHSRIYDFIESYKAKKDMRSIASFHFNYLWEQFPDFIRPYLPKKGSPEQHIKSFLEYEAIIDIPEFHIISNIFYSLFELYGIDDVETGNKDDILLAVENISTYLPYCHFYVTTVDIAELIMKTGINEAYNVMVYDHNESSLYKLIQDLTDSMRQKQMALDKEMKKSMYKRGGNHKF